MIASLIEKEDLRVSNEHLEFWALLGVLALTAVALILLVLTVSGCAATANTEAVVQAAVHAVSRRIETGDIRVGGGDDSIALWLSIISGPASLLAYMGIIRPMRLNALAKQGRLERRK